MSQIDPIETFQSSKLTTLKLQEPYKLKLVSYSKGYKIELTLNGDEFLADKMRDAGGPIIAMIREAKAIVKNELNSKILEDVD